MEPKRRKRTPLSPNPSHGGRGIGVVETVTRPAPCEDDRATRLDLIHRRRGLSLGWDSRSAAWADTRIPIGRVTVLNSGWGRPAYSLGRVVLRLKNFSRVSVWGRSYEYADSESNLGRVGNARMSLGDSHDSCKQRSGALEDPA